ncbi:MAG: type IV pilus twitching motility protein PilT [Gemmatimonadaceae bacterium]
MKQLDRLIAAMQSSRATGLLLATDEFARLVKGGAEHPITKKPLTTEHIASLMDEALPTRVAAGDGENAFEYVSGDATYQVVVTRRGGRLAAEVTFAAGSAIVGEPDGSGRALGSGPTIATVDDQGFDLEAREAIDDLLRLQVERGSSDLHLRSGSRAILRTNGSIVHVEESAILSAFRVEALLRSIMPARNRDEFAATSDTDFAYEIDGLGRFRVNAFRDSHGAGAVFRAIPSIVVTAEALKLSPEVQALCKLTKGLVLVTGPTGSGKSTTLSALVDLVNRTRQDHIITIEDPIEFVHQSKQCLITQRQVGVHTGSFKHALRAALREDPDVVLVGELRDLETVSIAIETAETGHLVFGTMHTSTAASTIDRIIDQFPADRQSQVRVMLSESLKGVIAQSLCKKIGGGRVAAMEILLATPALSNLIREAKTFQIPSVMQTSRKMGMVTLNDALLELVDSGMVEPLEAYLKAIDKSSVGQMLKARGHDVSFLDGIGTAPNAEAARQEPASGLRPNTQRPVVPGRR